MRATVTGVKMARKEEGGRDEQDGEKTGETTGLFQRREGEREDLSDGGEGCDVSEREYGN